MSYYNRLSFSTFQDVFNQRVIKKLKKKGTEGYWRSEISVTP